MDSRTLFRSVCTVAIFLVALFVVTLSSIGVNRFENISSSDNQDLSRRRGNIKRFAKTAVVETLGFSIGAKRRLFGVSQEAKKEALKGLEKPFLEPPRRALSKSSAFLKNIKYLPDLLHDHTLDCYRRRVFVTSGSEEQNRRSKQWFYENYPLRNRHFEVFEVDSSNVDVSGWLLENVGEEDYVILKAEAGAVEEMMMMKSGAISLLDELFLECKNQWGFKERNKSKRAYWECLSLYGRLKDEGVAVHQWWE